MSALPPTRRCLVLLLERAGGDARGVGAAPAAYLSSLPSNLDTPLFWSDDEIDMLRGTQLLQQVYGYRWAAAQALTAGLTVGNLGRCARGLGAAAPLACHARGAMQPPAMQRLPRATPS